MSRHVAWQTYESRQARWAQLGQSPAIAWLTGLSGAGKTCIADAVDRTLAMQGRHVVVLDGDNLRHGLNKDLGFTPEDRAENVRRAAEVACLMAETGLIVIVALISPLARERAQARGIAGKLPFFEVFVDTPLSACESRDPKGLYALARTGRISQFTGISAPYEAPEAPDLTIRTEALTVAQSAAPLCALLLQVSARPN
jgi:adenylyl-sulfate kinase